MIALLVGSEKDASLALRLQDELTLSGCIASIFYPDLGNDYTLPARAIRVMEGADYFIYLVTEISQDSSYLKILTPENIAPLCAVGVKIILVVSSGGSLAPELAFLPCLYFLDEEILPILVKNLVESLVIIDAVQPADLYDLRFGARDLEAFLETAQALSMAYSGLESAWDEMPLHDPVSTKTLFNRYTSDVSFGVNFISHVRLESRTTRSEGYSGPLRKILDGYKALERDWLNIEMGFSRTDEVREKILEARTRAASFIDLIYLIMALKLQPYCDQYMHMHGLRQKMDTHFSAGPVADAAQERLSFLMNAARNRNK